MSKLVQNHSLPARLLHWINAIIMALLISSGFYISNPQRFTFFSNMNMARYSHFILMYLACYGLLLRAYFAIRYHEYTHLVPRRKDLADLRKTISYYLFFSKDMPDYKKYNPLQKIVYFAWIILFIVEAVTGFSLYRPETTGKFFAFIGGQVFFRQLHILVAWTFAITFIIHVYMALLSGWKNIAAMIYGTKRTKVLRGFGPSPVKHI